MFSSPIITVEKLDEKRKFQEIEYNYSDDGNFYYRWIDVSENFKLLPVPIKFVSNQESNRIIYPTTKVQILKIPSGDGEVKINNQNVLFGSKKNKKLQHVYMSEKNN